MPVHDWTRVSDGIFHDFHYSWVLEIKHSLMRGLLPVGYYLMAEQSGGDVGAPDLLTLQQASTNSEPEDTLARTATLTETPPAVQVLATIERDSYARQQHTLVVRHTSDDRILAMIEVLSRGNKIHENIDKRNFIMRISQIAIATVTLLTGVNLIAAKEPPRLDRNNLLQYRDAKGNVQPVKTAADWQKRRTEIMRGMVQVMGNMPSKNRRVALDIKVEEEVDAGKYIRRLITYQSEPGGRTPAYLCIPKDVLAGKRKAPAVLCLHPTDNKVGHKVVLGLGGRPGRQYAAELAERGCVTLSPSYPHLANYWPNLGKLGYVSGTMKAIWDNSRGLDLLASLPYVDDRNGFGAIGHSLGGHNAIYTAVFDKRITVLASSCGFDSYLDYINGTERVWYFGQGWCQIRYMPRLSNYRGKLKDIPFDFQELAGALAPRKFYVNAPLRDSNFRWRSVDKCAAAARPIYKLFGGDGNLIIRHPDADHSFPEAQRAEAYAVIDSVLKK